MTGMRMVLGVALLGVIPSITIGSLRDDPKAWVYFDSLETGKGPRLVLDLADGSRREVEAESDTIVIAYLEHFVGASHAQLAVDLRDQNRVLLRFVVPHDTGPLRGAEIVLRMHLSQIPPKEPFEIALFRIDAAWDSRAVDWTSQPPYGREALVARRLAPADGEVRIPVTEIAKAWVEHPEENHGLLLRVSDEGKLADNPPAIRPAPTAPPSADVLDWAPSVEAALERAAREGRFVLAFVDAAADPSGPTEEGELLVGILLVDPDVRDLIDARYVPVRIGYHPQLFTLAQDDPTHPLHRLGAAIPEVKAPALLLADARGRNLGVAQSLGTFDREAAFRFLARPLPPVRGEEDPWKLLRAGDLARAKTAFQRDRSSPGSALGRARVAALEGRHGDAVTILEPLARAEDVPDAEAFLGLSYLRLGRFEEAGAALERASRRSESKEIPRALYYLGCLRERAGNEPEARKLFQEIVDAHATSPWAVQARLRLATPERMSMYETLAALPPDAALGETAVPSAKRMAAAERALDALLDLQRPDGSWPIGDSQQESTRSAVTAIAAQALLEWDGRLSGPRRERARGAVARAVAWIDGWSRSADAESANSFATAYVLDFQIARLRLLRDAEAKDAAQRAVHLLEGGQCPNGAWSYDRRFGTTWTGGFGGWPKTDQGRVHSMNTGLALRALADAKDTGLAVSAEGLERGVKALLRMKTGPAAFTYTWPDPVSWEKLETSMGRAPLCELALVRLGQGSESDLDRALDYFMEHHRMLRGPVKLTAGWTMPTGTSSYFYFFAYFHAAEAIDARGGANAAKRLAILRDTLLEVAEPDGTWVDFQAIGKAYGTAMALRILRRAMDSGGRRK